MENTSYQNRLRAIGVQLDREHQGKLTLLEVPGGFIVRVVRGRSSGQILEFTLDDFPALLDESQQSRGGPTKTPDPSPLFPTGYQDGLRAVGYLLDQAEARSVLIVELSNHLLIAARRIVRSSRTGAFEPFEHYFSPEEMTQLLDEAFKRRRAQPEQRSAFRRFIDGS
jgi:hypothetical protein